MGVVRDLMVVGYAATDKRKTMIKELAASYRNECQTYCRQLLLLQRQWKKVGFSLST